VSLTTALGRAHPGPETERHEQVLAGLIENPNVAAALIVGFEADATERLAGQAAAGGKPVHWRAVLAHGSTTDLLNEGVALATGMVAKAGATGRAATPLGALTLGLKCGGSDPTSGLVANAVAGRVSDRIVEAGGTVILTETEDMLGAEHVLARRAVSRAVADRLLAAVARLEEQARAAGMRLSALHEDHIAAGLTTNEEKALGAIQKAGCAPLAEVVSYAERPAGKGLVFMDALGGGIPEITGLAAAGAQIILFVTGTGHPTGNPVAATLKMTGNPRTAARHAASIDVDVSGVLSGELGLDAAARQLHETLLQIANGRLTRNEMLGDVETAVSSPGAWASHLVS
jgi:altronate dehydratase large subunit